MRDLVLPWHNTLRIELPGSVRICEQVWRKHVYIPLPKVTQAFESAVYYLHCYHICFIIFKPFISYIFLGCISNARLRHYLWLSTILNLSSLYNCFCRFHYHCSRTLMVNFLGLTLYLIFLQDTINFML